MEKKGNLVYRTFQKKIWRNSDSPAGKATFLTFHESPWI